MNFLLNNLVNSLYEQKIENKDLEKVKQLVSNYYRIPKEVLDKVKVKMSNLPTIYVCFVRRIGDYLQILYKPIAKILGLYDPKNKEIYIDKNISYNQKIKTALHEYVHAAQDYLGKLSKLNREKLEEEARSVSEHLFKIYNQASQKFLSFLNYLAPI